MYLKNDIFLIAVFVCFWTSFVVSQNKWTAPASANSIVNPLKGNETATAEGMKIFNQVCAVCHGVQGKGNGIAGVSLTPKPASFLSLDVINETDGAVFWKISEGKAPMASYKTTFTENQRWGLVNYIRKLEKSK